MTIAVGISLEVLSRVANTRVLNDTEAFCSVDEELRNWCGINTSQPFAYCIISETWPQYDVCMFAAAAVVRTHTPTRRLN